MSAQPNSDTAANTTDGRNRNPHHIETMVERENPDEGDEVWIEGKDQPYTFKFYRKKPDLHIALESPDGRACGLRRSLTNPDNLLFIDPETMVAEKVVEAYLHKPADAVDVDTENDTAADTGPAASSASPMPLNPADGDISDPDVGMADWLTTAIENFDTENWATELAADSQTDTEAVLPDYSDTFDPNYWLATATATPQFDTAALLPTYAPEFDTDDWAAKIADQTDTEAVVPSYDDALDLCDTEHGHDIEQPSVTGTDAEVATNTPSDTARPDTTGQASLTDFGIAAD